MDLLKSYISLIFTLTPKMVIKMDMNYILQHKEILAFLFFLGCLIYATHKSRNKNARYTLIMGILVLSTLFLALNTNYTPINPLATMWDDYQIEETQEGDYFSQTVRFYSSDKPDRVYYKTRKEFGVKVWLGYEQTEEVKTVTFEIGYETGGQFLVAFLEDYTFDNDWDYNPEINSYEHSFVVDLSDEKFDKYYAKKLRVKSFICVAGYKINMLKTSMKFIDPEQATSWEWLLFGNATGEKSWYGIEVPFEPLKVKFIIVILALIGVVVGAMTENRMLGLWVYVVAFWFVIILLINAITIVENLPAVVMLDNMKEWLMDVGLGQLVAVIEIIRFLYVFMVLFVLTIDVGLILVGGLVVVLIPVLFEIGREKVQWAGGKALTGKKVEEVKEKQAKGMKGLVKKDKEQSEEIGELKERVSDLEMKERLHKGEHKQKPMKRKKAKKKGIHKVPMGEKK
jgi:hypothetical protein